MIMTVDEIKTQCDCGGMTDDVIKNRLNAIEAVIREFTHNNFQNRDIRFKASSDGYDLTCEPFFIKVGDTVQISQSKVNDGLYVVDMVADDRLTVDRELFAVPFNLVTKIEYPADVVQCAVDLFEWKKNFGAKIGIKSESETLSRHSESVTYEDSATLFMGYPVGILSGLSKLHNKARW